MKIKKFGIELRGHNLVVNPAQYQKGKKKRGWEGGRRRKLWSQNDKPGAENSDVYDIELTRGSILLKIFAILSNASSEITSSSERRFPTVKLRSLRSAISL